MVQQNKNTMALTTCPECGREVSDTAVMCPHCGKTFNKQIAKNSASVRKVMFCLLIGFVLCVSSLPFFTLANVSFIFALLGIAGVALGIHLISKGLKLKKQLTNQ